MTGPGNEQLAALIARIADGDQSALAALFDHTVDFAHSVAQAIVKNRADAEEVVLDAFTQVWRTAGSYRPGRGKPLGWLAVVVRSRALDRLRQRRNHVEAAADRADPSPGPDELMALFDTRANVRAALASLKPAQRQVLGLAFLRDHSHREIAEILDLPLGTVKSHARRALSAMQLSLTEGSRQ